MYQLIRELAKRKGISIPNLEKACGLSNGSISKWSTSSPSFNNLQKVADYLEVSMDVFKSKTENGN